MSETSRGVKRTRFIRGSGNVFQDLGLPDSDEVLARARLAEAIDDTIEQRRLTQSEAAALMGVDQPTVSKVVNGRLDGFSQERLIRFLASLGADVEIIIHRPEGGEGRGRIRVLVSSSEQTRRK
jgi:predicted XRE-type DNA-binding protein